MGFYGSEIFKEEWIPRLSVWTLHLVRPRDWRTYVHPRISKAELLKLSMKGQHVELHNMYKSDPGHGSYFCL